jgi:hypothetical protein
MKWALLVLAACTNDPMPGPTSAAGHYTFELSNCAGDDASDPVTGSMQLLASTPPTYTGVEMTVATPACSAEMGSLHATLDGENIELDFQYGDGSVGRTVIGTFVDGSIAGNGTITWNAAPYNRFLFSATRTAGSGE